MLEYVFGFNSACWFQLYELNVIDDPKCWLNKHGVGTYVTYQHCESVNFGEKNNFIPTCCSNPTPKCLTT